MLAFNFDSGTFAYRRLAQGLSRALSAFSSFMHEYPDKVIKTDQCASYEDDIGIAANIADQLIRNLRATIRCIRTAGLNLTMHICLFGAKEIDFLGRTISTEGERPQKPSVQNFLAKTKSRKSSPEILGFSQILPQLYPQIFRETDSILQTIEKRRKSLGNTGSVGEIHRNQQRS